MINIATRAPVHIYNIYKYLFIYCQLKKSSETQEAQIIQLHGLITSNLNYILKLHHGIAPKIVRRKCNWIS